MKKLMSLADVAIVVGGSEATRRIVPRLGYGIRGSVEVFARVIRPVRQARSRPSAGIWKDAARLLRNAAWARTPLGPIESEWRIDRVARFDAMPELAVADYVHAESTAEYLNYWLRCPVADVRGFEIHRGTQRVGGFLLSRVAGQARVAAMWLATSAQRDWERAYRLAVAAAAEERTTCEIVGFASTPVASSALRACGFRHRDAMPLFTYEQRGSLAGAPPMFWNAINDDAAYVFDPANPYRT
jgi:hypothetical protein